MAAAVSVLLLVVVIGEAGGQAPGNPEPTPAEMAKAIAHAIDANALKIPNAPVAFDLPHRTTISSMCIMRQRTPDFSLTTKPKAKSGDLDKQGTFASTGEYSYLEKTEW